MSPVISSSTSATFWHSPVFRNYLRHIRNEINEESLLHHLSHVRLSENSGGRDAVVWAKEMVEMVWGGGTRFFEIFILSRVKQW